MYLSYISRVSLVSLVSLESLVRALAPCTVYYAGFGGKGEWVARAEAVREFALARRVCKSEVA